MNAERASYLRQLARSAISKTNAMRHTPGGTRTHNLSFRRASLYPFELLGLVRHYSISQAGRQLVFGDRRINHPGHGGRRYEPAHAGQGRPENPGG